MIQRIADWWLEVRIHLALNRMLNTIDRIQQRDRAADMARLIKRRSPEQVERMEQRMGLK